MPETQVIGNVEFRVEVLKSETKKTDKGVLNCVWTPAGYFEFYDQPLKLVGDKLKIGSSVYDYANTDYIMSNEDRRNPRSLVIDNLVNGQFKKSDDELYYSVGVFGDVDRDYSSFTFDIKNGKKENFTIMHPKEVKVISDDDDKIKKLEISESQARYRKGNTYVDHAAVQRKSIFDY